MIKDEFAKQAPDTVRSICCNHGSLIGAVVVSYGSFENVPEVLMNLFADQCNREAQIKINSECLELRVP
jgi:hypothetical protein